MRVNPNPLPDILAAVAQTRQQINTDNQQIATGLSVNVPSDNPAAAAVLVQNADQTSQADQFQRSIGSIQGEVQNADSTLSSVITSLQQAISLGVEGANGTVSASDQAAIVKQLQGIQSQIVSLANTSYENNYLFAGTVTNKPPYVANSADPSGVTYQGNGDVNQVSAGDGYRIAINQPGSQLFSASGNSVFLALNQLIQAVQSNSGIQTAVTNLTSAANYLSAQGVFYGNSLDQAQSQTTYLNAAKLQLAQQQNALGGVDLATAASELAQDQTDSQAALEAISKMSQNGSLFSYLS